VVGAPICARDPWTAKAVNFDAVKTIADMVRPEQMLIFPSTNSGYGVGEAGIYCDEDTPLRPMSLYGRLKVELQGRIQDPVFSQFCTHSVLREYSDFFGG